MPARAEDLPPAPATAEDLAEFNPEQLDRIGIAHLRSGLLPGEVVGSHHVGLFKVQKQRYTSSGRLDDQLEEAARRIMEAELVSGGYPVSPAAEDEVFEEPLADAGEVARFLIGGKIVRTALNSYGSFLGDVTRNEQSILWKVLDRDINRIIYSRETSGEGEAPGVENPAATYDAIRASFRNFLRQPELGQALHRASHRDPAPPAAAYEISALPSSSQPLTIEQIAGQSIPAIVRIRTPGGRGSGFFLDASGLVVTNWHVVGSAFSVQVDLYDGSTYSGRVLRRDPHTDVALVKLTEKPEGITGLPLCYTHAIKVGEAVVAIGHPLSLTNTVTRGIISAIRTTDARSLIQTDVAVNPGNSGGPLLNQSGAVVGLVTEKIASRGVEGLSFALPIGEVLQKLNVQIKPPAGQVDLCGNPTLAMLGS